MKSDGAFSDAVRILLTRTANEGALPIELLTSSEAHDAWFRTKVLEALNDPAPDIEDAEVENKFSERRAASFESCTGPRSGLTMSARKNDLLGRLLAEGDWARKAEFAFGIRLFMKYRSQHVQSRPMPVIIPWLPGQPLVA